MEKKNKNTNQKKTQESPFTSIKKKEYGTRPEKVDLQSTVGVE